MKFHPLHIDGACLIEVDRLQDDRGFFARLWCGREFEQHGIGMEVAQASISHNAIAGTLRGMHFQWAPSREAKLDRCQRGSIYDVILDLRPDSATYAQHVGFELDDRRHNALYIPPGCAHGFQTLAADTEIVYLMSDYFRPDLEDGVRYDDPAFGINWPLPVSAISTRDLEFADFDPKSHGERYSRELQAEDTRSLSGPVSDQ